MSDALTPDALGEGEAAAPDGSTAPSDLSEVEVGSAGGQKPDTVEASRFNGLMAAFNREKAEREAERARYEAELANLRNAQEDTDSVADSEVLAAVQELQQELLSERLKTARAEALREFPEAAPFADMIVGGSPEEVRTVAANLAERVRTHFTPATPETGAPAPGGETAPETETPAAPEATVPVAGGAVAAPDEAPDTPDDRMAAVLQQASEAPVGHSRDGLWSQYLAAAVARAEGTGTELA